MPYFPIFQDISGKNVLIVGGGRVAARKAENLLPFGADITVCAPEICEEIQALNVLCKQKPFAAADLDGNPVFVIAASNSRTVNQTVQRLCDEKGILVNVVDDPAHCSFLFPSLVTKGELCVGISTGGSSPSASKWLREQLEAVIPDNFGEILADLQVQREHIKAEIPDERLRSQILKAFFAAELAQNAPLTEKQRQEIIKTVGY